MRPQTGPEPILVHLGNQPRQVTTVVPTPTMIDPRGVAAATARELDPNRKVFHIEVPSIHPSYWLVLVRSGHLYAI